MGRNRDAAERQRERDRERSRASGFDVGVSYPDVDDYSRGWEPAAAGWNSYRPGASGGGGDWGRATSGWRTRY